MVENYFQVPLYFENIHNRFDVSNEISAVMESIEFANAWQPHNDTASTTYIPKKETNIIKNKNMNHTFSMILTSVEKFLIETEQPYIKDTVNINQSWINKFSNDQLIGIHDHGYAFNTISGVYYHKTPKGCGSIEFKTPIPFMSSFPFESRKYPNALRCDAEEGLLILFPSWLKHSVTPNRTTEERISLSFNVSFDYIFYKETE